MHSRTFAQNRPYTQSFPFNSLVSTDIEVVAKEIDGVHQPQGRTWSDLALEQVANVFLAENGGE
jgi:hypothetical protein